MLELVVEAESVEVAHAKAGTRVSVCLRDIDVKELLTSIDKQDDTAINKFVDHAESV